MKIYSTVGDNWQELLIETKRFTCIAEFEYVHGGIFRIKTLALFGKHVALPIVATFGEVPPFLRSIRADGGEIASPIPVAVETLACALQILFESSTPPRKLIAEL